LKGLILQKSQVFVSAEAAFLSAIEWAIRYNPDKVWNIHRHLAKCYVSMRANSQAENAYEMAIQGIENQRALLQKDDNRIGYYELKVGVYQEYIHFKIQQKQYKEAFDLLQRASSRALLDLLQERHGLSGNQSIANYAEIKASLVY
jgi:tetratricopeptide (TPR) repeat protein